jgi:hypothetical protein
MRYLPNKSANFECRRSDFAPMIILWSPMIAHMNAKKTTRVAELNLSGHTLKGRRKNYPFNPGSKSS